MIILLQSLCILFLVALFHESGHLVMARLFGVPVPHIQLGVWYHIVDVRLFGTRWRMGLLPLGGYTRVHGMDPKDGRSPDGGDFRVLHPVQQGIIIAGGVLGNVVLAMLLTVLVATITGVPLTSALIGGLRAPLDILHGVAGLWADSLGLRIPGAPVLHVLDGTWLTWLRTTASISMLIALLNLVPTTLTDGGRLWRMVSGRASMLLLLIAPLALVSCRERPKACITDVITAKERTWVKGTTRYAIGFEQSRSRYVDLSLYTALQVGDTVCVFPRGTFDPPSIAMGPCDFNCGAQ